MSDIGGMSERLLALALVHLLTAVAVLPTGLLLPANFYRYVWIGWAVTGVIAWLARKAPPVLPSLVLVDAGLVGIAHIVLPGFVA